MKVVKIKFKISLFINYNNKMLTEKKLYMIIK
jgi:hypothetical protein